MNQEYDNTNSGALFKNDRKETEKHPDMRGSLNVEGVDYWVSCWFKVSKKGNKFMSLALQKKEDVDNQGIRNARAAAQPDEGGFVNDDIPF